MAFITNHLLSLILFIPTAAALILLALPAGKVKLIRWYAFGASLVPLALAVFAWTQFQSGKPGF